MHLNNHNGLIRQLVLLLALSTSVLAHAESSSSEAGLRPSYKQCLDASDGVTSSMNDCIGIESDYQDLRLNQAYQALMSKLDRSGRARLKSAERTWIRYRDSHCATDKNSGTAEMLNFNACLLAETAKQADSLEDRLNLEQLK